MLIPEITDGFLTVKGLCQLQLNRIKMFSMPDFIVTPNPANDDLDISFNNLQSEIGLLNIYSLPGENLISVPVDKKSRESGIKLNISYLFCIPTKNE